MTISLDQIVTVAETDIPVALDLYKTVKAAVVSGGGALAEIESVVVQLLASAQFKTDLTAAVTATKSIL